MAGKKPRADADVLPSPPQDPWPEGDSSSPSGWRRWVSPQVVASSPALDTIAALRDCAAWICTQSGYYHDQLAEAGLKALTRQGYEDRPDYLPLRYLQNISCFLDNMHQNYAQPRLLEMERQRLSRPTPDEKAAHDVLRRGNEWFHTAELMGQDLRDAMKGFYQAVGVKDLSALPADHPFHPIALVAEEAITELEKALVPARTSLETLEKTPSKQLNGPSR